MSTDYLSYFRPSKHVICQDVTKANFVEDTVTEKYLEVELFLLLSPTNTKYRDGQKGLSSVKNIASGFQREIHATSDEPMWLFRDSSSLDLSPHFA